jgi:hypothetical protein
MGLSWQQGPLSPGAIGRFLVPESLPKRLLYAEPLRRRMRVRFGGTWIADSENILLLVQLDGVQLRLEPGQAVIPHGPDRNLTVGEALPRGKQP